MKFNLIFLASLLSFSAFGEVKKGTTTFEAVTVSGPIISQAGNGYISLGK